MFTIKGNTFRCREPFCITANGRRISASQINLFCLLLKLKIPKSNILGNALRVI